MYGGPEVKNTKTLDETDTENLCQFGINTLMCYSVLWFVCGLCDHHIKI